MSFDQKKFLSSIPSALPLILNEFQNLGYVLTVVGGIPRDYLLTGKTGTDWDLEVSHPTLTFNKDSWKDLGKALKAHGKVTFLPYEIIRLEVGQHEFEFSPQRKEEFLNDVSGHSNFTANYDLKMTFAEAVQRRDFTINAMGIRFHSDTKAELLDPLQGALHLHDKQLYPVGQDFAKDPVRLLRAVRFSVKLGLSFSPELSKILKVMPLGGMTPAYVWSEAQKSKRPVEFFKLLLKLERSDLSLPLLSHELDNKWEELSRVLTDPTKHETWMIALEWMGLNCSPWQQYFSVSSETSQRLARWAKNSKLFIQLKPEIFHGEFELVREKPEFEVLFDWYFSTKQLLQKNPSLPLMKMIEEYLPDWIHLYRFEVVKDVKHIDPPFRGQVSGLEFMSAPLIFNLKDPRSIGFESQLREIFFESSTKKEFKNEDERKAFEWKYLGFYLSHYPEYAWMAVEGEKLLGYVVGMPFTNDPTLYELQPHLKKFSDLFHDYPAHLHINCHVDARGKGIGAQLTGSLFKQLKGEGIHGLHIMTGTAAENRFFYKKQGFDFEIEKDQILFMGVLL